MRKKKAEESVDENITEVRCPKCKGWCGVLHSSVPRYAITIEGRIDYIRTVYRCRSSRCLKHRSPFDEELGLKEKEHFTPLVQKKIAWAGAMITSYDKASEGMKELTELAVSPKEMHRISEYKGQDAVDLQDKEVFDLGRPASPSLPVPVENFPETVVLEMDGTCVMGRDGEGHEVKCATVFGLDSRKKTGRKERPVLINRSYCATSKGISVFGSMVWAMSVSWGVKTAKRIVIIGDGGDWIWKYSRERFNFAYSDGSIQRPIEILDFYHAAENLTKARDIIFKDSELKRGEKWYKGWVDKIKKGKVDKLISELDKRSALIEDADRKKELEIRASYFRGHKDRMNYPDYEKLGLPIGSGAIEGTCKNLIKGRMACVGQRWDSENNIERMTALRVRIFNKKWDDLWPTIKSKKAA